LNKTIKKGWKTGNYFNQGMGRDNVDTFLEQLTNLEPGFD
jgi:hypothetical protein